MLRFQAIVALTPALIALPCMAFDLEGHRGTRGLAPENTLAAFRRALDIGVTTLETDLAVTRDSVLVISHERWLNPDLVRTPDGRWLLAKGPPIHTLTLAELKRYDIGRIDPSSRYAKQFPEQRAVDGERFPTLAQVFDLAKAHPHPVRLNIETKLDPAHPEDTVDPVTFARLVVDAVTNAQMSERVTVQSFDWRTLREVKKLAPSMRTACLTMETNDTNNVQPTPNGASPWTAGLDLRDYAGSVPRLAQAAGCDIWSPFWRNVTPQTIAETHSLRMQVLPWTVNEPSQMARLIDEGVDGIITDYPDRLRKVMEEKGLALPQ